MSESQGILKFEGRDLFVQFVSESESMFEVETWNRILKENLGEMKPFSDIETKVLIEETFFVITRESKELMSNYIKLV